MTDVAITATGLVVGHERSCGYPGQEEKLIREFTRQRCALWEAGVNFLHAEKQPSSADRATKSPETPTETNLRWYFLLVK